MKDFGHSMETASLCKLVQRLDIINSVKAGRIAACIVLLTTLLFSEKHFSPPPVAHANTYALHEAHNDEKVTIAAEPCDTPKTAGVFKANYQEHGLFPVRLLISND